MSAARLWPTRRSSPTRRRSDSETVWLRISNSSRAGTDEQGHFVIDRLPPGEARVFWQPEKHGAHRQRDRFYQPAFVEVLPGETARLDLVEVVGRPCWAESSCPTTREGCSS